MAHSLGILTEEIGALRGRQPFPAAHLVEKHLALPALRFESLAPGPQDHFVAEDVPRASLLADPNQQALRKGAAQKVVSINVGKELAHAPRGHLFLAPGEDEQPALVRRELVVTEEG